MRSAGFNSGTAIWLVALVAFFNFAFTVVGLYLVDRWGRRRLTLASLGGVVCALALLGVAFLVQHNASARATEWRPSTPVDHDKCFSYSTCIDCIVDTKCGFLGDRDNVRLVAQWCVVVPSCAEGFAVVVVAVGGFPDVNVGPLFFVRLVAGLLSTRQLLLCCRRACAATAHGLPVELRSVPRQRGDGRVRTLRPHRVPHFLRARHGVRDRPPFCPRPFSRTR